MYSTPIIPHPSRELPKPEGPFFVPFLHTTFIFLGERKLGAEVRYMHVPQSIVIHPQIITVYLQSRPEANAHCRAREEVHPPSSKQKPGSSKFRSLEKGEKTRKERECPGTVYA